MSSAAVESRNLGRWATALLSGGGLAVSWYLLEIHVQARLGDKIGGAVCGAHEVVDCASAAHSSYAELFGLPIALLGLAFYLVVMVLALFDPKKARESSKPFRPAGIAVLLYGLSLGYSLFLAGVSAFVLKALCPFCVMLYLVNGLGLVGAVIWAGEKPWETLKAQLRRPGGIWNGWILLGVLIFGFTVLLGDQSMESALSTRQADQNRQVSAREVERLDPQLYRRSDAPAKGPVDAPVHIVEFSNFPCPFCGRLASVLHQIAGEYPDQVRIEFRHFPLASQPMGYLAARAAYCAGEEEQFWPMHDRLFLGAADLSEVRIGEHAAQIGLDRERFESCLNSDVAHGWIDRDVADGQRLGIEGTPTFFLNGARVGGAVSLEVMRGLIDEELERVRE